MVDECGLATGEVRCNLGTGNSGGGELAAHLADVEHRACPKCAPLDATQRQVLTDTTGRYGMAVAHELVDHVGAPEAQCLPWPAVMETGFLNVALDAAPANGRCVDGRLRHAASRAVDLGDGAELVGGDLGTGSGNHCQVSPQFSRQRWLVVVLAP